MILKACSNAAICNDFKLVLQGAKFKFISVSAFLLSVKFAASFISWLLFGINTGLSVSCLTPASQHLSQSNVNFPKEDFKSCFVLQSQGFGAAAMNIFDSV